MDKCKHCGKTDFDFHMGCLDPEIWSGPSVGDWFCKKNQHGGKRQGAGRPQKESRKTISTSLLPSDIKWLKEQPETMVSNLDEAIQLLRETRNN